jgi:hypothetical protein
MVLLLPSVTSIGSLMRTATPYLALAIFCLFVLVVIREGRALLSIDGTLHRRSALATAIAGWVGAYCVLRLATIGTTYFAVLTVIVIGFVASMFLVLVRDDSRGFFVFIFVIPFLDFMDYDIYWKQFPFYLGLDVVSAITPLAYYHLGLYTVLVLLFSSSLIIKKWFAGERLTMTSLDYLLITLILWVALSVILSPEPGLSLAPFLDIVAGASFYVLVRYYIRTTGDLKRFCWVMLGYAWLAMFLSLYFRAQNMGFDIQTSIAMRWFPRDLSSIVVAAVVMLPLSISLFQIQKRKVWTIVLIIFSLSVLFIVITSETRNHYLALILCSPAALMYKRNKKLLFCVLFFIEAIAFVFFSPLIIARFKPWYSWQAFLQDQRMRLDGIQAAISMMQDHPLFGTGPGRWAAEIIYYGHERLFGRFINHAHNLLLHTGSVSGIPAMLSLLLIGAVGLIKLARSSRIWLGNQQVLAVGLLWGLGGLLVSMISAGGVLTVHNYSIVFFSWVGLSTKTWRADIPTE